MNQRKWDYRFLAIAREVATWSHDPSLKVGAVLARGKKFISLGFNGFPEGINDAFERYADRDYKMAVIMHAEENCIRYAPTDIAGATIYVTPYQPCSKCASWIIAKGIKRVVTDMGDYGERWVKNFEISSALFKEAGVTLDVVTDDK